MKDSYDVVVVGAGINGLSSAYHLLSRGVGRVALLEQFELLHGRGSSHGYSRITRSTYNSARYADLVQTAHREDWPRLSRDTGATLLHPTPGCFFGPHLAPYLESLQAVPEALAQVNILSVKEGRKRFPFFRFPDTDHVVHDLSCSLIAARTTMESLAACASKLGCDIREGCLVESLDHSGSRLNLKTSQGSIECDRVILTAGPWIERLIPSLTPKLRVAHQDVGYFLPRTPNLEIGPGNKFPVWVYAGKEHDDSFYGLPEYSRPGIKIARHRTGSHKDNPDRKIAPEMPPEVKADLESFAARQFAFPLENVGYEACLYTNTPNEDFLLDHYPGDSRIVIGAGFSGHGFKFGPLTGRILVGLLLDGSSGVEAFERHRSAFQISRAPSYETARS